MTASSKSRTRLRSWREDAGLSLGEMSDLVGISTSMLSRVERGQRQFAPMTRVLVARRLGVQVRELFEVDEVEVVA